MDELIDSLLDVIQLKTERDKAFESCESSWGYFGHDIESQLQKAKERFGKALDKYIISRTITSGKPI